jgi:hypothetical protein
MIGASYLLKPGIPSAIYVLLLPVFPFYWTPLKIEVFNLLSIQHLLGVGLAVGLVAEGIFKKAPKGRSQVSRWFEWLVVGMVVVWSISNVQQNSLTAGIRYVFYNLIDFWVPSAIGFRMIRRTTSTKQLFNWILWPAFGIGVLVIIEYIYQTPFAYQWFDDIYRGEYTLQWMPSMRATLWRIQATFGQSIFLGFYLVFAGVISLITADLKGSKDKTIYYILSISFFLVSLVTLARGPIIGAVITLIVYGTLKGVKMWRRILLGLLVALVLISVGSTVSENLAGFWGDFIATASGQGSSGSDPSQLSTWDYRLDLVRVGTNLLLTGPLLGFGDLSVGDKWGIPDITNVFIEIGLGSGIIGLALFMLFIYFIVRILRKMLRAEKIAGNRVLSSGLASLFLLIVICWLDSSWPGQFTQFCWILIGVIAASGFLVYRIPSQVKIPVK